MRCSCQERDTLENLPAAGCGVFGAARRDIDRCTLHSFGAGACCSGLVDRWCCGPILRGGSRALLALRHSGDLLDSLGDWLGDVLRDVLRHGRSRNYRLYCLRRAGGVNAGSDGAAAAVAGAAVRAGASPVVAGASSVVL